MLSLAVSMLAFPLPLVLFLAALSEARRRCGACRLVGGPSVRASVHSTWGSVALLFIQVRTPPIISGL